MPTPRSETTGGLWDVADKAGFRFYFFSREEARMHVHVYCDRGEAKFWLERP
ncbi:MAG: DUF4160 domain-containing protein [Nitrospiraceae bacterium]|nr:DUF4160 domain-containing protein [Nitrospiraceae bacterium]